MQAEEYRCYDGVGADDVEGSILQRISEMFKGRTDSIYPNNALDHPAMIMMDDFTGQPGTAATTGIRSHCDHQYGAESRSGDIPRGIRCNSETRLGTVPVSPN